MFRNYLCKAAISICISALAVNSQSIQLSDSSSKQPIEIVETMPLPPSHQEVIDAIKDEVRFTQNWDANCYDDTIQISYEDAQRLLKIAYSEAGNQGCEGQLLVMQTIWNRVQSEQFPNTIQEVIEQESQFSSVSNGSYYTAEPNWESHMALAEFEKNLNHDDMLIGFETINNGSTLLKYFDYYKTYQDHMFYTQKKH